MNVSAAKNTEPGMKIPVLIGKVEELYQRREGQGKYGPWTVQKAKLSEGRDWIFVDFWNKDDLAPYKGHQIKITDDKGIEVKDNSYNDSKTGEFRKGISFSAGKGAVITSPGFGDDGDDGSVPSHPQPAGGSAPVTGNSAPVRPGAGPNEPFVKRRLNQLANLYLNCVLAADYIFAHPASSALLPDDYREVVTTLFIQSTREGLTDHIAVGKFNKVEPRQEQPEPQPPLTPTEPPPPPPGPQRAPRTPSNPQHGDHRDDGLAFPPNEDDDSSLPF